MIAYRRTVVLLFCLLPACPGMASAQSVPAPRSFEAIAVSPTEIRLYWLPPQGAIGTGTGYRILRDGQVIATLPATAQEYDDTGLTPDSTHTYVVQAMRGAATSLLREYVERTFAPFPSVPKSERNRAFSFDVVVAQASSGGVAAAIEAAKRGLTVALIEPTTRVGGMPVNGLSATDLRRAIHASGFFVRFRDRVRALYAAEGVKTDGMQYAPRVAHQAMKSMLYAQPGITLYRRARLARVLTGPGSAPGRQKVEAVEIEALNADGQPTGQRTTLRAKEFIDATDCGDLAAWAGAPFRVGREARSAREPHNGVIYYDRKNDAALPGSTGKADRRIQSYAYLIDVKDYGRGADKTIPMPPGYRRDDFVHAPAWKDSWAVTSGKMPGGMYELNQHPQGNDLQAINYGYPTASYAERARIEKRYRDHVLGYLYYIQTEQGQKQLGLPDDEFRDSGGFPPLLYVREGRRILGEQLPEEADITEARNFWRPESVGIGDYPMDSHAVEPKTDWNTPDMGEGEWWLYKQTPWHELPLGILIPRTLDNVFVTTAVSSTHVSFGTYRLEPVRMAFGEAAAIAADLCIRYHRIARDIPARQVQDALLPDAANPLGDPAIVLSYFTDVAPGSRNYREIQYLAARGFASDREKFEPSAPTTRAELASWLALLADRAAPPLQVVGRGTLPDGAPGVLVRRPYYPYMGPPASRDALRALRALPDSSAPATRAEIAHALASVLGWLPEARFSPDRYDDLTDPPARIDAASLGAHFIDSTLWDGAAALRPDGKFAFQPEAPLSHADLFETLYLAQLSLGPLFDEDLADIRNGRTAQPMPSETIVVSMPSRP
jgi:hypothetical protein